MAKSQEKLKAFALRREGKSIKEIANTLGVTKETASKWMQEIVLTESEKENLHKEMTKGGHKGRMIGAEMNRNKKIERIKIATQEAKEKIIEISNDELFYLGLGIYWGEGSKTSSSGLAITNSDPSIIKIMIRWFIECFGVKITDLGPRIYISDIHVDREERILDFWVNELGIPRNQFKKTIFLNKGKKVYENREVYYGVLTLYVAKGTDLRCKILSLFKRISEVHTSG
jgi:transposase-like protein